MDFRSELRRVVRLWPLLMVLALPVLRFPGALPGPGVVSAHDHLSVHHAFQVSGTGGVRHPHLSDPALQFAALRLRTVEELAEGRAPLWNPDIFLGAPLLGDAQSMPGSPVTWARLVAREAEAADLGTGFVLLWLGLGTALLALALGVGAPGAAVAGVAAMAGPFPSVWLLHPHAATFCWLPWVLLAVERRSPRGAALAVLGMVGGGHPGTLVHGLALALLWLGLRRRSVPVFAGILVGLLLAAPLLFPVIEQVARSSTLGARGGQTLPLSALRDLVWPGFWGHPATESWVGEGSWANGQLHPGFGALLLAVVALISGRRPARLLWALWAVAVLISLTGAPGPIDHSRLASEGAWLLALAAGVGVGAFPRVGLLALALVVVDGTFSRPNDQGVLTEVDHSPREAPWVEAVRRHVGCSANGERHCGRVLGLGWALQPNTGALVGLRDVRGYDLPVSRDTHALMAAFRPRPVGPWFPVDSLPPPGLLALTGVKVVLSTEVIDPKRLAAAGLVPLSLPDAPLWAYAVADPGPVAWMTGASEAAGARDLALRRAAALDPGALRAHPPVEASALMGAAQVTPLAVEALGAAVTRIRVAPTERSLVVLADAWAPGWRATVDGAPAQVLRVGGAVRGVIVAAGAREVVFRYRPDGWIWGQRGALVGLLLFLGLLVFGRDRARRTK